LCGGGGIGFVHTTTVHRPSRAKRLFSIAGFGIKMRVLTVAVTGESQLRPHFSDGFCGEIH
jgi:hypothetical protein